MVFGIKCLELNVWKVVVKWGEIVFLIYYWFDECFLYVIIVIKVGCSDLNKLIKWGKKYGIFVKYIDNWFGYFYFDLLGEC